MASNRPWTPSPRGLALRIRLTPRAARDAIEGIGAATGRPILHARVRAVPEKGAANAALIALVANWLGVAKSTVAVTAGATSRIKTVEVAGAPSALEQRLLDALARLQS